MFDSRKEIKIQVTQEDIDKGQPNHCGNCPIALAAKRVLLNEEVPFYELEVDGGISFYIDADRYIWEGNLESVQFVKAFDNGFHVEPLELEVKFDILREDDYYDGY